MDKKILQFIAIAGFAMTLAPEVARANCKMPGMQDYKQCSFLNSCRDCDIQGTTLRCSCRHSDLRRDIDMKSTLNLATYTPTKCSDISNDDGKLKCKP